MSATSHLRGNPIEYDNKRWVYSDDKSPISVQHPCTRCGEMPTKEGYDACLGHIEGAESACCGHGVVAPILIMESI